MSLGFAICTSSKNSRRRNFTRYELVCCAAIATVVAAVVAAVAILHHKIMTFMVLRGFPLVLVRIT